MKSSEMTESILSLNHVSKKFRIYHERKNTAFEYFTGFFDRKRHFEEVPALKDINLEVERGEMLGVVGPNGSGKSTLLRVMAGIYEADSGSIVRNGTVTPLIELGAGFNPALTARDNIIQYGILLGLSRRRITEGVSDILKFAELERFEDIQIRNFSTGMVARLAFSTAMQVNPDILLVDEVLSVGDEEFNQKSYEAFLSFKSRNKAIVYVSHDLESVNELCDKAVLLLNGSTVSSGKPNEVIETYLAHTKTQQRHSQERGAHDA